MEYDYMENRKNSMLNGSKPILDQRLDINCSRLETCLPLCQTGDKPFLIFNNKHNTEGEVSFYNELNEIDEVDLQELSHSLTNRHSRENEGVQ